MRTGEDNDGVIKNWRIIVVAGSEAGSLTVCLAEESWERIR
jgi:hypothetical protein